MIEVRGLTKRYGGVAAPTQVEVRASLVALSARRRMLLVMVRVVQAADLVRLRARLNAGFRPAVCR
jgi:hypothetical protein